MQKTSILAVSLCLLLCLSCQEKAPIIVPCQTDRMVLAEEFTGLACVGCPAGHRKIKQLQLEYPNKIIPIAIHAGFYSKPSRNPSGLDWRTPDGDAFAGYIIPSAYPAVVVNRKLFKEKGQLDFIDPITWAGPLAEELCQPADASVDLSSSYDAGTREVTLTIKVGATNGIQMKENIGLSVLITESHLIANQKEKQIGWITNYEHNHVLRDYITDVWGTKIQDKGEVLEPHTETMTYTVPNDWVAENCHIVAFVHYQGDERYVLQATEAHLVP